MSAEPFADPMPSAWGYNWKAAAEGGAAAPVVQQVSPPPTAASSVLEAQWAHLPAALLGSLKRDKKPFTYTPGGVNLSEVLNARLQKRLERKQRYSEEEEEEERRQERVLVVRPTYNTPLDMYSAENALEALEVQAELVPSPGDKSLCSGTTHTFRGSDDREPEGRVSSVMQSKAFRVLQIITDTEEETVDKEHPQQQHRDKEMRFTGIRDHSRCSAPSPCFHTLHQKKKKITGTDCMEEEEEEDSPPPLMQPPCKRPLPFVPPQPQQTARVLPSTTLKRPAAFLPIKTLPGTGYRPVRPPPFSNGVGGGTTDF